MPTLETRRPASRDAVRTAGPAVTALQLQILLWQRELVRRAQR